jgi:hypothetical protein
MPGVAPEDLSDDDLDRDVEHLHATRHETFLNGTPDALAAHTERMLALESEFVRRFPERSRPDPARVRPGGKD